MCLVVMMVVIVIVLVAADIHHRDKEQHQGGHGDQEAQDAHHLTILVVIVGTAPGGALALVVEHLSIITMFIQLRESTMKYDISEMRGANNNTSPL